MLKFNLILGIIFAAYLIQDRSVVKHDPVKEAERIRIREMFADERKRNQDILNCIREEAIYGEKFCYKYFEELR